MADETLYVNPPQLRSSGTSLMDSGDGVSADVTSARRTVAGVSPSTQWAVVRAADTMDLLWGNYVTNLGTRITSYGGLVCDAATAYETRDTEAAEELNIALPDEPGATPAP